MQPAKGSAVPPQHLADASGSRSPFLPSSCLPNPVAGAEPWVEHEAAAPAHREQLLTFYWGLKRFGNCHHHVGTENLRESRGVWGDHGCIGGQAYHQWHEATGSFPHQQYREDTDRLSQLLGRGHTEGSHWACSTNQAAFSPTEPM